VRQVIHLREAMDRAVLSIAMLSELSGVSRGTISRILAGEATRPVTLHRLAKALKIPIQQLVTLEEDQPSSSELPGPMYAA